MSGMPDNEAIERFYADVGRKIRDIRTQQGLTQAHLAARAAMTRSSVANIEAGRQRIAVHVLVLSARALNVEPSVLISSRSLESDASELDLISEKIERESPATQEFIRGAIAQLAIRNEVEGE